MPANLQLTSAIFWESAAVAGLIDAGLICLVLRLIPAARFRRMRVALIIAAGAFWGGLGIWVVRWGWDAYYRFFYPEWMGRWGIVLFAPALGMVLAVFFFWVASRYRRFPVPVFLVLAGGEALLEHLMGIYVFRIMDISAFRGVDPVSMLVFSVPEYILYWCAILLLAGLISMFAGRFSRNRG